MAAVAVVEYNPLVLFLTQILHPNRALVLTVAETPVAEVTVLVESVLKAAVVPPKLKVKVGATAAETVIWSLPEVTMDVA